MHRPILARPVVRQWFGDGILIQQRYMLVYYDMFDWLYYPGYAKDDAEYCKERDNVIHGRGTMQAVVEVYDLLMDKETQVAERCAMHGPPRPFRPNTSAVSSQSQFNTVPEAPFQHD